MTCDRMLLEKSWRLAVGNGLRLGVYCSRCAAGYCACCVEVIHIDENVMRMLRESTAQIPLSESPGEHIL